MEASDLVKKYVPFGKIMQIATVADDQPWACTVYYVADEDCNLYWLSLPSRRHSKELTVHSKVAISIPVQIDKPVIGLQAQGRAEIVTSDHEVQRVMHHYIKRHGVGQNFYDKFLAAENQHAMYKFIPELFVVFDEVTFTSDVSRQEWRVRRLKKG